MSKNKDDIIEHKVYLRAFELDDEEFLIELRKKTDVFEQTVGNKYFTSTEHSKKLLRENLFSDGSKLYLMICLTENDKPIGYLVLSDIEHINKKLKWSGIIIDPLFSGKGYGTLAASEMLKFAFEELNMNKVYTNVFDTNKSSLRMHDKLGFIEEGFLRDHVFKSGRYHGVYYLSLLKKEYDKHKVE